MPRPTLLLILTATLLTFAGCDTVKAPPAGRVDPLLPGAYPQVTPLEGLDKSIYVGQPSVQNAPDKPMSVVVKVRNITDGDLPVQYHFIFLDAAKRPIAPDAGWRFVNLPSRAERTMEASALDRNAVDWRLEIRPQR